MGQQAQDSRQPKPKNVPRIQVERVSHSETTAFDPLWDGPRLVPSFVTQVLAQAMADNREPDITVETAYGTAAPRRSLADRPHQLISRQKFRASPNSAAAANNSIPPRAPSSR